MMLKNMKIETINYYVVFYNLFACASLLSPLCACVLTLSFPLTSRFIK